MDFGVIIGCSGGDFHFAKGCLASVKYFMPDVPICLLIDGAVDTREAEAIFGCSVLKKENIQNEFLKQNSFGWGVTKMNCFWESPFEKFLFLDADVCVWGDIMAAMDYVNEDFVIDQPQYVFDKEGINTWFFDTSNLNELDKDFNAEKFADRYFCTGIFLSRKGVFDLSWYQNLTEYAKVNPITFKYGEMGMLNYMIFKSVDMGKLKVTNKYVQHICPDFDKEQSKHLFQFSNGLPVVKDPMVLHYNGNRKPYLDNKLSYHEPMTYFRSMYLHKVSPELSKKEILKTLRKEDNQFKRKLTLTEKLKNLVRPILKPTYLKIKNTIISS